MQIAHFFHQLLLQPLELIFEVIYGFSFNLFHNSGVSIFCMSLCMNLLLLPLYRRADAIQEEQRAVEKRLEPGIAHIKKVFKGDERFMMLQAYYRKNNYKPYYALRGSLPLVLEIPFFIAAYRFLSNLEQLHGAAFGPIRDLGAPDALLTVGGVSISLLPILMTLINFLSSAIYTKGLPRKDKLQLIAMALVFLVLLYASPSGLVLYWTLNNLFSLVKNLITKSRNPRMLVALLSSASGLALFGLSCTVLRGSSARHRLVFFAAALLLQLPAFLFLLQQKDRAPRRSRAPEPEPRLFWSGALLLTLLTGVLIPSAVIRSSPSEFVLSTDYFTPLLHVLDAFLLAAGLFLVWFGLFYYLADRQWKRLFEALLWAVSGMALADYMIFGATPGTLSAELSFDRSLSFPAGRLLANLAVLALLLALLLFLLKKKRALVKSIYLVLCVALVGMSALNIGSIQRQLPEIRRTLSSMNKEQATIPLSRDGKNVVVLMMDKAISGYIPYLFQERPELEEQFAGFTYYPNAVSFGAHTNIGTPGLFGGYEYTPEEMNKRTDTPLVEKHNEALKVMPVLFNEAGWSVTVCDPSYAGYGWIPDLSIFDDYPSIRSFITEEGQFSILPEQAQTDRMKHIWSRNFFCYSVMKISPLLIQPNLYLGGTYFDPSARAYTVSGLSQSRGYNMSFISPYSVLCALPEITQIESGGRNSFFVMANSTTHNPMLLQEPEYEPREVTDNTAYDAQHADRFVCNGKVMRMDSAGEMSSYHANMAAMLRLGQWFDTLRDAGVYDNTRIIIVSDHGGNLRQFDNLIFGDEPGEDAMWYQALLMVKDFDSQTLTTDERLMTNADTPTLAMEGLIQNPVNPFTGNAISSEAKNAPELHVFGSHEWHTDINNGSTFLPGVWYAVHDDVRVADNWTILGEY